MRTKALLLTAALSALGMAAASAQVYSVNAVGYVNVTLKKGYNLIANPLNNGDNTLNTILPASTPLPDDCFVVTWNPAAGTTGGVTPESPVFYPGGGWEPAGTALPPGKSFLLYVSKTAPQAEYTVTFVGEVAQGSLSNPVTGGGRYTALASQVPQTGKLVADLGFTALQDDFVMLWDKTTGAFSTKLWTYDDGIGFNDGETVLDPEIKVGEGFFLYRKSTVATPWTRTFNVNQ